MKNTTTNHNQPEVFLMEPADPPKGWKKKYRYHAIDKNGEIWIPGLITGRTEMDLVLCASFDGEGLMEAGRGRSRVILFRAEWLKFKGEAPKVASDIDAVITSIRKSHSQTL